VSKTPKAPKAERGDRGAKGEKSGSAQAAGDEPASEDSPKPDKGKKKS